MTCIEAHPDQTSWSPAVLEPYNRLPVHPESNGTALMIGRQSLQLPSGLGPVTTAGELMFASDCASLLLGPWGPDPRRHLMLRGRLSSFCTGGSQLCLELEIERGLPLVRLSLPRHRYENLFLKHGQRLWISIPADALQFAAEQSDATDELECQWPESGYSPALG